MLCVSATVSAQMPVVMLHHEGTQTPYWGVDGFKQAYEASVNNDTIYLSGGVFNQPSEYRKGIHIYGTGFLPDSAKVTTMSILSGDTKMRTGADNFHMEGVYVNGKLTVSSSRDTISQIRFIASRFNGILSGNYSQVSNAQFIQCVFTAQIDFESVINSSVQNCAIYATESVVLHSNNNLFDHNYFTTRSTYRGDYVFYGQNNVIRNCVGIRPDNSCKVASDGNMFYNNINLSGSSVYDTNENNYTVDNETILDYFDGSEFSWNQDLHLKNPEKYIGTDGAQVGVYGGTYAWPNAKASLPSNPIIRSFIVPEATDESGKLQIKVQVGAKQ